MVKQTQQNQTLIPNQTKTIQQKIQKIQKQPTPNKKTQRINQIKTQLIQRKLVQLEEQQIAKAVKCLLDIHSKKESKDLLNVNDDFIYLEVVVNKVPLKYTIKPELIELPHPIYSQEMNTKFCIFSQNPQRKFKDFIADLDIPLIQRVIGYSKVPKKYPSYADKRKLMYEYDQFFCDKSIYRLLDKSLGKIFYERKKQIINGIIIFIFIFFFKNPISNQLRSYLGPCQILRIFEHLTQIHLFYSRSRTSLVNILNKKKKISSTIKISRIGHSQKQIIENVIAGYQNLLPVLFSSSGMTLSTLRFINLKLAQSVSLPIYVRLSEREKDIYKKLSQN